MKLRRIEWETRTMHANQRLHHERKSLDPLRFLRSPAQLAFTDLRVAPRAFQQKWLPG